MIKQLKNIILSILLALIITTPVLAASNPVYYKPDRAPFNESIITTFKHKLGSPNSPISELYSYVVSFYSFITNDFVDIEPKLRLTDPTKQLQIPSVTTVGFNNNAPNRDTITSSAINFELSNFTKHGTITVTGSASNDGTYTVEKVEGDTITLTTGASLTTEAEGATVTLLNKRLPEGGIWYNAFEHAWKYWNTETEKYALLGALPKYGTITSQPTDRYEGVYTLDAGTGAFDFTLPKSDDNQSFVYLITQEVETNNVTIKVETGDRLNNVLNGIFELKTNGNIYLASDNNTGFWDIYEIGRGLPKYGTITADPTIAKQGSYNLDSGGGTFNFSLEEATGSQKRIILNTENVEANGVTVTVPTGEFLNGIQNNTHILNVDSEVYIATDLALNQWIIQPVSGLIRNGDITADPTVVREGVYNLDASGGAFDFTLPIAKGTQKRVYLFSKDVETNNVTVKVQAGEYLSDELNGTKELSIDGFRYLATDRANGRWDISKIGGDIDKKGSITADPAGAKEGIYTVNASGGAFDFTLASATGSQERVYVIAENVENNRIISWSSQSSSENNSWQGVTYGGGQFVAVSQDGTNRVMTSPDGITWTNQVASEANTWNDVVYGGGQYVAVSGNGTNRVMTSPDGITWTARAASAGSTWRAVTYGNGLYVAIAQAGGTRVMTSPDGITWTSQTAAEANTWQEVAYGNGIYAAVSADGTNRVMTSPDGATWSSQSAAEANTWTSIAFGNGKFVAVSISGTNRVMTSEDGLTWTAQSSPVESWLDVTFTGTLFVATSSSGTNRSMYSFDGENWTSVAMADANVWSSVAGSGNTVVGVAGSPATNQINLATVASDPVTIKVPTGQSLNNVVNGEALVNTNGQLFLATDRSTGKWDVKTVGEGGGLSKKGTVTSDADDGEGIYGLDASGGAFDFTLPAATGSQDRRMFFAENVAINSVTIKVQSGDALNTVTDGTFTIDNNEEILLATDQKTGGWVISVMGAGQNLSLEKAYVKEVSTTVNTSLQQITGSSNSDWDAVVAASRIIDMAGATSDIIGSATVGATAITIGKDGRYSIDASVTLEIDANKAFVQLVKNGTDVLAVASEQSGANAPANFALVWEGDLSNTDTLDLRVDSNSTNNNQVLAYHVNVNEVPSTEAVLAGMVVPTTLSRLYARMAANQSSNITGGTDHIAFDVEHTQETKGTNISLDTTTAYTTTLGAASVGRFTLKANKQYRLTGGTMNVANPGNLIVQWQNVNAGADTQLVASNQGKEDSGTAENQSQVVALFTPGVDTLVELKIISNTGPSTIVGASTFALIEEVPISTVVDPGDVPVEALAKARIRATSAQALDYSNSSYASGTVITQNNNPVVIAFDAQDYDTNGSVVDLANNKFVVQENGSYDLNAMVTMSDGTNASRMGIQIIKNGTDIIADGLNYANGVAGDDVKSHATAVGIPLVANDEITLLAKRFNENASRNTIPGYADVFIELSQVASKTVIDTTNTSTNDQTTSGYFDIGNMRMQWGTGTAGTPVGFPTACGTVPASVVATVEGTSSDRIVATGVPTTTGVTITSWNTGTNSASSGETFNWQAICEK